MTNEEMNKQVNEVIKEKIYLLAVKQSKEYEGRTYCIAVIRLGTENMEFTMGETDNDKEYLAGDEVLYVYNAEYTTNLYSALDWLKNVK